MNVYKELAIEYLNSSDRHPRLQVRVLPGGGVRLGGRLAGVRRRLAAEAPRGLAFQVRVHGVPGRQRVYMAREW